MAKRTENTCSRCGAKGVGVGKWGKRLARLARRRGWTRAELAAELGIGQRMLLYLIGGTYEPREPVRKMVERLEREVGR